MSQDKDLSTLTPVDPDPGKYQWVRGKCTGTDESKRTAPTPSACPT